jgi:hypothetical protein
MVATVAWRPDRIQLTDRLGATFVPFLRGEARSAPHRSTRTSTAAHKAAPISGGRGKSLLFQWVMAPARGAPSDLRRVSVRAQAGIAVVTLDFLGLGGLGGGQVGSRGGVVALDLASRSGAGLAGARVEVLATHLSCIFGKIFV